MHFTGCNTLALYFCVSMFGHGDDLILAHTQTHTQAHTHTQLQTVLRT